MDVEGGGVVGVLKPPSRKSRYPTPCSACLYCFVKVWAEY